MNIMTLTNGISIECFDYANELNEHLTNDLQNFKEWFTSILYVRNGRFENLWVRKGTSNKFIKCDLEKRWSGMARKIVSNSLKFNSIHYQENTTDLDEQALSSLISIISNSLFQKGKGDLGIYLLFNPLLSTMRIVSVFKEIEIDHQQGFDKNMEIISQMFTILCELHGSISMYSPQGVLV